MRRILKKIFNRPAEAKSAHVTSLGCAHLFLAAVVSMALLFSVTAAQALSFRDSGDPNSGIINYGDEVIYQVMVDRFDNGDPSNDNGDATNCPVDPIVGDDDIHDAKCVRPNDREAWHGGDYAGLMNRLDYIKDLGFTTIWLQGVTKQSTPSFALTPCCGNNTQTGYHGYHPDFDPDNPDAIDPHYGTQAELESLIAAIHAKGMKVIFDLVINHTGYDSALLAKKPEYFGPGADLNFDACLKLYKKEDPFYDDCVADALAKWWSFGLPDLNHDNKQVRDFIKDRVQFYNDLGFDGYRLDTALLVYGNAEAMFSDSDVPKTKAEVQAILSDNLFGELIAVGGKIDPANKFLMLEVPDSINGLFGFLPNYTFEAPIIHGGVNAYTSIDVDSIQWFVEDTLSAGDKAGLHAAKDKDSDATTKIKQGCRKQTVQYYVPILLEVESRLVKPAQRRANIFDSHDGFQRFLTNVMDCGYTRTEALERWDMAMSMMYFLPGIPVNFQGSELAAEGFNPYDVNGDAGGLLSHRADMFRSGAEGGYGGAYSNAFERAAADDEGTIAKVKALNQARKDYVALRTGVSTPIQMPTDKMPNLYLFARQAPGGGEPAVVVVLNNSDAPADISVDVSAFLGNPNQLTEVTGKSHGLLINNGVLSGTVAPRTALGLTGAN